MTSSRLKRNAAIAIFAAGIFGWVALAQNTPAPIEAEALPIAVAANDANVLYEGRFDGRDPIGPRAAWPSSAVALRFRGNDLNARIRGGSSDRWQIEVDGKPTTKLALREGEHLYRIASDLKEGEHLVRMVKATEAFFGTTQFVRFELNRGAQLLAIVPPKHHLEIIGDSISAGYGNEAASKEEHFSADTENAYFTYGAIAARELGAGFSDFAWSGKKIWPDNTLPELYDLALPTDKSSVGNFKTKPDAVLINLATNDFAGGIPDETGWTKGYKEFVMRVRRNYPDAQIYCAIGTMMGDWDAGKSLTTLRRYLAKIVADVKAGGDEKIKIIDFGTQDGNNGFGADWHPNLKTHRLMADQLRETLRRDLGWQP